LPGGRHPLEVPLSTPIGPISDARVGGGFGARGAGPAISLTAARGSVTGRLLEHPGRRLRAESGRPGSTLSRYSKFGGCRLSKSLSDRLESVIGLGRPIRWSRKSLVGAVRSLNLDGGTQ